jgi:hemerythrin-like domain-containing protein
MKKVSENLMSEHKSIWIALDILERMFKKVRSNEEVDYNDITGLLDFLGEFADKCHHAKEEKFLFPELEAVGMKNQGGPIEAMLVQHKHGRELVQQMWTALENGKIDKQAFSRAASSYVNLMRNHIKKENSLLFPTADKKFPVLTQEKMIQDFENLERYLVGTGRHEELHAIIHQFENKYIKDGNKTAHKV